MEKYILTEFATRFKSAHFFDSLRCQVFQMRIDRESVIIDVNVKLDEYHMNLFGHSKENSNWKSLSRTILITSYHRSRLRRNYVATLFPTGMELSQFCLVGTANNNTLRCLDRQLSCINTWSSMTHLFFIRITYTRKADRAFKNAMPAGAHNDVRHQWRVIVQQHSWSFFRFRRGSAFVVRVVAAWNRLPQYVLDAPSVATFKQRLDRCWQIVFGV